MACIINASTASGLIQSADTSGNIQLQWNGVAAPAFSAFNTGAQSITNATFTKVILQNEDFDTANCFDSTTNYRFTPTVAGYYQINGIIYVSAATSTNSVFAGIFKNGTVYQSGSFQSTSAGSNNAAGQVSTLVYLNGTTDYVELYGYASVVGAATLQNAGTLGLKCQFSGVMVRGA
jgi:hypothetical protein